ncbi:ABC transporter substrate-binding protein [Streptomyces sp. NPDC001255]|uniref:ABC transporter substrate-binding protein n=1 Tax=Streptomyces sp. NPDC001255 TaxID=3364550 RepID=UPI00367C0CC9
MPRTLPLRTTAVLAAAALGASLAGCSSDDSTSAGGKVTITVQGLPQTSDPVGRKAFQARVAEFEKKNPKIHVVPSDAQWNPQTFATKLAGGSAETLVRVPLTEPQGLIGRRQVRDLTADLKTWPQYDEYNKKLLAPLKDKQGKVYGLTEPASAYSMGLVYNRDLFRKAGLDPDRPPTTWDEVRTAAKAIHDKTGAVGYAETTTNNTGGWHLTAHTYARGGAMTKKDGDHETVAFTGKATKDALRQLHAMRFTDDSMGRNQLQDQADVQRRFAAGKVGMYMDGPSAVITIVQRFGGDKNDVAAAALPQAGGDATQLGGTVDMVNARATSAQTAAVVKWIVFEYLTPYYDPAVAGARAERAAKDPEHLVGVPSLAAFSPEIQRKTDDAIKPYANVPTENYRPYVEDNPRLRLRPEPPVAAQKIYAALDPVVQAVLTDRGADIDALLDKAAGQVRHDLESAR